MGVGGWGVKNNDRKIGERDPKRPKSPKAKTIAVGPWENGEKDKDRPEGVRGDRGGGRGGGKAGLGSGYC